MTPQRPKVTDLMVKNVDRDGLELRIGDRVGFIMRGWFLPREQESFGTITAIDKRGAISIEVTENYRRFTSSKRLGLRETSILFTHYIYDPKTRTRTYSLPSGEHRLSIFRVNNDEFENHKESDTL